MEQNTIAQSNNYIVLNEYNRLESNDLGYQSEADLEKELIRDLVSQGYEYLNNLTSNEELLKNIRVQLELLNRVKFSDNEWGRFCKEYLDKVSDTHIDKTKKIHDNYIYDFVFDDGHIENIYLVDKKDITRNKLQVITQFKQVGVHANRYDVTILVNGLPMVQIELKKRGIAIREAFNQLNRYTKESFNSDNSLFKYLQIFIISNGTDSRYFANTTKRDKNSYDFTMNWADSKNKAIRDLKDFTATFLEKNTILKVLLQYSVFDVDNNLLIMRPYQIAATERILWKIQSSYNSKKWKTSEGGGYIWHTTGSGKTLTSFKAARLATELDFIDKVFFVVDRKDLDYQTIKEYQRFSPDSVNGSENTKGLKENIDKDDNKIIVTTIQKLNNLVKRENDLPIYDKQVVFIFDEAHRSQFGEAQSNIRKKFKKYYQFGFTGTPIFAENALGADTTRSTFGEELHSYVITDAIRDGKVLKFKVDYNDVRPKFKAYEEDDENKLSAEETKQALLHPQRIKEISQYILDNFRIKTHRANISGKGFNAMFAVSSVDAAKAYYEMINLLQANSNKPLKVATIFSFAPNETQASKGEISEENFEPTAMDSSAKEFLTHAINDYNKLFKTNYGVDSNNFQEYYRDLAKRVKNQEVDLIIVVGMFLTGFDAPTLNTLFVDKNLRYHGLIQAFSRTNRIYNATKTFGNIVTFRNLEKATIDAIELFGDKNTKNFILERSYNEYMYGYNDLNTGQARRGYIEVVNDLTTNFANVNDIETDKEKKAFVKTFGEYLRIENILQNYDEYSYLKAIKKVDVADSVVMEEFRNTYGLDPETAAKIETINIPSDRAFQDYRSAYEDIRKKIIEESKNDEKPKSDVDWSDIVFEVDLLNSQEINLDYILELIFEKNKNMSDKKLLVDDLRSLIRSSVGNRAKESLIIDFINSVDLNEFESKSSIVEAFYIYAQAEQKKEAESLIASEKLNELAAKRYITNSLRREYASDNGTELNEILPKMSRLNKEFITKKRTVFNSVVAFVDKFKGIGGSI